MLETAKIKKKVTTTSVKDPANYGKGAMLHPCQPKNENKKYLSKGLSKWGAR
jgi:hypothetical protein